MIIVTSSGMAFKTIARENYDRPDTVSFAGMFLQSAAD